MEKFQMETALDQAAYAQPAHAPAAHTQDHQKSMFEDSTSFPDAPEAETSSDHSYEASDFSSDSLPDEAPDEDVVASAPPSPSPETSAPSSQPDHHDHPAWHAETPAPSPEPLTVMTIDDFSALEERVLRAVNLVRRERQARLAAEERLLLLESQALAQAPALEQLQQEVEGLRLEREQVRQRVERLLSQLDALEL
jgi:hypothetical protein